MKVSIVHGGSEKVIQYPCLMQTLQGSVVLQISPNKGVLLAPSKASVHPIGEATSMNVSYLTPFHGKLELSND